ncbi:helix-turn-helix transcriptional regulator [Filifactor alocis]
MDQTQIGIFISELRKEKNLTQLELGELLGVTNKTVSRWENGNYMPDISIIPLLCQTLEITINEFFSAKKLEQSEFKEKADDNLYCSIRMMQKIKKRVSVADSFSGAGVGLLLSCLFSSNSDRRTIAIVVALILLAVGYVFKVGNEKMIWSLFEKEDR